MNDKELLEAMRRIAQPDEHRCFGCGYEHGCSLHGCAVILRAIERLETMAAQEWESDAVVEAETEIYAAALKKWGPEAQTLMVMEEMSELQKELCKNARGRENKAEIGEEIADVLIMLNQMIVLHKCAKEVVEQKQRKLERLKKLLTDGEAET